MKKVFVILLSICLIVLSGCKPALPGATIHISNETNNTPDSYELNILFDDSRATDPRAFHMKNIGSEIATSSKAIVLENMPQTVYIAEVVAYRNGEKVGYGTENFQASVDSDVYVSVKHWEKPFARYEKNIQFPLGTVDSITLNITDKTGNRVESQNFENLSDTTFLSVKDKKIRVEMGSATFEWILKKGSNAIAVYTDTVETIAEGQTYKLKDEKIDLSLMLRDMTSKIRKFNEVTIEVKPDSQLREKISAFRFEISSSSKDTASTTRNINAEDRYTFTGLDTGSYSIKVTPIMNDAETALNTLSKNIDVKTNVPLLSVVFENISIAQPYEIELRDQSFTFDIRKNPEDYTSWESGSITSSSDIVELKTEGNTVTVTPTGVGSTTLTYAENGQSFKSDSMDIRIVLHKPEMKFSAAGSYITIFWDYVHPSTELYLITTLNDGTPETTAIKDISKAIETIIPKQTKVVFQLMVKSGDLTEYSEEVRYETGKENFIGITIPEMKDMDIVFSQSVSSEDIISMNDTVVFEIDRRINSNISEVHYMVNSQLIRSTVFDKDTNRDQLVFIPEDLNIDIHDEGGIVPLEVVIAVKATDGSVYSKNITLNLNLESRK